MELYCVMVDAKQCNLLMRSVLTGKIQILKIRNLEFDTMKLNEHAY